MCCLFGLSLGGAATSSTDQWHLGGGRGRAAGGVSGPGGRQWWWFGPVSVLLGLRLAGVWLSMFVTVGGARGSVGR
jgi:hypothetical protein